MTHRKRVKEQHKQEIKCQRPLYVLNGGADFPLKENREDSRREGEGQTRKEDKKTSKMRTGWGVQKNYYIYIYITISCLSFLLYIKLKSRYGHHNKLILPKNTAIPTK